MNCQHSKKKATTGNGRKEIEKERHEQKETYSIPTEKKDPRKKWHGKERTWKRWERVHLAKAKTNCKGKVEKIERN